MNRFQRVRRHARLTTQALLPAGTPPFLILFINSICNQTCEHCFYWRSLNQPDDLSFDELEALSRNLGRVETLNLSGGEPFLRKDLAEICRMFVRNNRVRQIYVPTNGSFAARTVQAVSSVLEEKDLDLFVCELSLDGMPEFHNRFRGMKDAFERSMATYDELVELQRRDARLRIHSISTATNGNMEEIRRLTSFLHERCPGMDHHNLAIIRGDRKNPTLEGPTLQQYGSLADEVKRVWASREETRYGSIVEPMLQWAKIRTAEEKRQVIPCMAGRLSGVVYANGDVSVCETHAPLGNLRKNTFSEIWQSVDAQKVRASIAAKECYCTNEVFLWPSIVFQPAQLVRALGASKPWRTPEPTKTDPPVGFKILQ